MPGHPSPSLPVEKFTPTTGTVVGGLSVAALLVVLVAVVAQERTLLGLRVALGAGFLLALVWSAMLRPRATAYADTLVLRGAVLDTHLPLAGIERASVRHALNVWVGDRRYVCSGIGRSRRSMMRPGGRGAGGILGLSRVPESAGVGRGGAAGAAGDYATFVETRIEDLARSARRDLAGEPPPVRRTVAVPEVAALVALGAAFVGSLLA